MTRVALVLLLLLPLLTAACASGNPPPTAEGPVWRLNAAKWPTAQNDITTVPR
jgi:hypothetical protein